MLTMAATLNSYQAKPAFIGNIYGGLSAVDVPPDAPLLFAAIAADDPLLGGAQLRPDRELAEGQAARRVQAATASACTTIRLP